MCARVARPALLRGPSTSPLDAMKCFTHQAVDAIGTCKSCGKGLCPGCAVDLHFALSCRGDCESELSAVRTQILRSRKLLETQARFRFFAPLFFGLCGAVFIGSDLRQGHFSWFTSGLGILFILFSIGLYLASRRWTRK